MKNTDLSLLEEAQQQLGDSVSSMFADFLRDRVAKLSPEESRIVNLINRVSHTRQALRGERDLPEFIDKEYAEAQTFAERALMSYRAGEIRKTKALFWAAHAYHDRAESDVKEVRDLNLKIAGMLGSNARQQRQLK